ncbi:MAG: cation diffusion facilitator family transporter [Oscillospiraceae bacterium]|jgi:cation diffusion facilitator family transporter|nr:cation diffusion facilitator family transporter [Oscillospiraceae bacterium]
MEAKHAARTVLRVSRHGIAVNLLLAGFKLAAGLIAHSSAMISDAVHTLSDVLSTVAVMIGVMLSSRASDKEHPYGHERLECVAAIVLAAVLCATGVGIGYMGVRSALARASSSGALAAPGLLALVAAAVSILVKEGLYRYTRAAAERTDSCALKADAWHHRSDALSSVGSFAGILGARLGLPILDPLAGAILCVFIVKAAVTIFLDSVARMTDRACDDETAAQIFAVAARQFGVRGIDQFRTRLFGSRMYVDVEIRADGAVPLREAHDIAQRVHDAIEAEFPSVKHCMVHVNPDDKTNERL